jgi:tRNA(Ile)-lysidine synthase
MHRVVPPPTSDPLWQVIDAALDALAVDRHAPLVAACSGGADSIALAHAAIGLARGGRLGTITLCHVDHGLRPGSAADGELVRRLAEEGGAGFAGVAVDVDRRAGSLEAAARDARYAALHRVAAERGAATILVGHTRRDQVETVLMRLVRGTGLAGLAGIPARRGAIARPLLGVPRSEVEEYCARHRLAVLDDPMNHDPRHLRARVRHHILPLLRAENPRIDDALLRAAAAALDARAGLDAAAAALTAAARHADGTWDVARLAAAAPPVLAHALTPAVAEAGGRPISAAHHAALLALVHRPAGGSSRADLPGLTAWREYDRLRFEPTGVAREGKGELSPAGPEAPYEVRPWRPGDRMRPVRLLGRSRKLSDLFTDRRVPRASRAAARVVVRLHDGEIVWAEHIGPAFGAKIHVTLTHPEPMATNKSR